MFNHDDFETYLFEIESALARVGISDCEDMQATTQLSASVYCLLRATSLFRATLSLIRAGLMDASDVTRRACWEAWMLGYEFRIDSAAQHADLWHKEKHKYGIAEFNRVKAYEESRGLRMISYGATYGGLSEVSHPTKSAAENSLATVSALHGDSTGRIGHAQRLITQEDTPAMMYILIWTVFSEWPGMISLGIGPTDIPRSAGFYDAYDQQIGLTRTDR